MGCKTKWQKKPLRNTKQAQPFKALAKIAVELGKLKDSYAVKESGKNLEESELLTYYYFKTLI